MLVVVVLVCAISAFIGLLMEAYKKLLRRNAAGVWEVRGVALAVSMLSGLVLSAVIEAPALSPVLTGSAWTAVPYGIVVYVLQLPACMKVWKPLLRRWLERRAG